MRLWSWVFCFFTSCYMPTFNQNFVEWTMVNVNGGEAQAHASLLTFPDGRVYMYDAGDPGDALTTYLKRGCIEQIDHIFISHAHKDHYGALLKILGMGIKIGTVHFNVPDERICDAEIPWGCDYPHVVSTLSMLRAHGVEVRNVVPGEVYSPGGAHFEVLYAFDGIHTPVGETDINDTSLIMKLTYGASSILFTGDLNQKMGAYLATHGENLESTYLQVPHHGTEGVAPNDFFDRVNPKYALVPSPLVLWNSERSKRIREYFEKRGNVAVNGIDGTIKIQLF